MYCCVAFNATLILKVKRLQLQLNLFKITDITDSDSDKNIFLGVIFFRSSKA